MGYTKPVCICGLELFHWSERMFQVYRKINKNGTISKKEKLIEWDSGAYERLMCPGCGNEYWIDEDQNGRVIRGEEFVIGVNR